MLKRVADKRLGEIVIYKDHRTQSILYCREIHINDKNQIPNIIARIQHYQTLKNQYITNLIDYSVSKQSDLCSSYYLLKVFIEFCPRSLELEIIEKKKAVKSFSKEELINLLYQNLLAFKELEKNNIFHGDLKPRYIGMDKVEWESKLIVRYFEINTELNVLNIQANNIKQNNKLYISPRLYEAVKKRDMKNINLLDEDKFALGLIFMEISMELPIQDLYKKGTFDIELFEQFKGEFNNRYSKNDDKLFKSTVNALIALDDEEQLTFSDIIGRMPLYHFVKEFFKKSKQDTNEKSRRENGEKVEHQVRKIDKSVEKPRTISYDDKETQKITYKHPFTERSFHIIDKSESFDKKLSTTNSKVVGKVIRRIETVDGKKVETVERYKVTESDKLVKIEETDD